MDKRAKSGKLLLLGALAVAISGLLLWRFARPSWALLPAAWLSEASLVDYVQRRAETTEELLEAVRRARKLLSDRHLSQSVAGDLCRALLVRTTEGAIAWDPEIGLFLDDCENAAVLVPPDSTRWEMHRLGFAFVVESAVAEGVAYSVLTISPQWRGVVGESWVFYGEVSVTKGQSKVMAKDFLWGGSGSSAFTKDGGAAMIREGPMECMLVMPTLLAADDGVIRVTGELSRPGRRSLIAWESPPDRWAPKIIAMATTPTAHFKAVDGDVTIDHLGEMRGTVSLNCCGFRGLIALRVEQGSSRVRIGPIFVDGTKGQVFVEWSKFLLGVSGWIDGRADVVVERLGEPGTQAERLDGRVVVQRAFEIESDTCGFGQRLR